VIYKVLCINTLPFAPAEKREELARQLEERPACAWHDPFMHGFLSPQDWHHQLVAIDEDSGQMEVLGDINPNNFKDVFEINEWIRTRISQHKTG
jgi:hypothetical protein